MWTDERVALLKKLTADGLSSSRIAAEIGGITRNAVIGKLHRMGIKNPQPVSARGTRVPRRRLRVPTIRMPKVEAAQAESAAAVSTAAATECDLPPDQSNYAVSLIEAGPACCRWPLNDTRPIENFLFCGAPVVEKQSYCRRHLVRSVPR